MTRFSPLAGSSSTAFLVLVLLAGCGTLSSEEAFNQVADTVHTRLGKQITWDAGQYDDPLVRAAIDKLLSRPLTPDTAVQIALLNNRELQSFYADLGIARANLVQAALWKNPIINGAVTFPLSGGSPDYTFDIALKLIDILYIPLRKRIAESKLEEAKFKVTAQVMSVAGQTYVAFIDYLGERQRIELLTLANKSANAVVESAKALRRPGNITNYDFEIEVVQQLGIAADLARAQLNAAEARERVNRLMGLTGLQTQWRSAERLPPVSPIHYFLRFKLIEWMPTFAAGLFGWLMGYRLLIWSLKARHEQPTWVLLALSVAIAALTFIAEAIALGVEANVPPQRVLESAFEFDLDLIRPGWLVLSVGLTVVAFDFVCARLANARGAARRGVRAPRS
jgi:outer membrane efflux protein